MFEGVDTSTLAGVITTAVLGLAGVAAGMRKWYVSWVSDRTDIVHQETNQAVVKLLRDQVDFLHNTNRELSEEVHKLRILNNDLARESAELRKEMYLLQTENATLKIELEELRRQIQKLTELLKPRV